MNQISIWDRFFIGFVLAGLIIFLSLLVWLIFLVEPKVQEISEFCDASGYINLEILKTNSYGEPIYYRCIDPYLNGIKKESKVYKYPGAK